MSEQVLINSFEFSRSADVLRGKIPIGKLRRLGDYLHAAEGVIDYELTGTLNPEGKSLLHLALKGKLHLKCQRCLDDLEHDLNLVSDFMLVGDENEFPKLTDENDEVDCILAETEMDVLSLLEEEIILKLPISPRHESGACNVSRHAGGNTVQSAFASLAALKKSAK